MRAKKRKMIGIKWLTKNETRKIIHARAKRVLGISGRDFVVNLRNGDYKKLDSDTCPGIIELALLAPEPKKSSGRKNRKRSV
jgi:hypothetical protein